MDNDPTVFTDRRLRTHEYETLVLVSSGRSTLDHVVQALDIHTPQARLLVDELERRELVDVNGDWCTSCLCYRIAPKGVDALQGPAPDGARGAETLREDESAILEAIARDGTLPDPGRLFWHASSTVQYLWEVGKISVSGWVRPRLSIVGSS